jgi:hydroxyacylglutathione hydrolase
MASRRRWVLWVWLSLFVLLVVLIGYVRIGRHQFDPPDAVRGPVVRVHGPVADFFLARVGEHVIAFDSGADPEGRGLDAGLARLHAQRGDIADLFLTHGHGDHIAGASLMTRARLHGGAADGPMMAGHGFVPRMASMMAKILPTSPITLTDALSARTEIAVGGSGPVVAIPFPGHTPGSMAYMWEGVLFVGDSMNLESNRLTFAFAPFSVDTDENRRRIAALGTVVALADVHVVCTAHGGCTREADTRRLLDDVIARAAGK